MVVEIDASDCPDERKMRESLFKMDSHMGGGFSKLIFPFFINFLRFSARNCISGTWKFQESVVVKEKIVVRNFSLISTRNCSSLVPI